MQCNCCKLIVHYRVARMGALFCGRRDFWAPSWSPSYVYHFGKAGKAGPVLWAQATRVRIEHVASTRTVRA